MRLVVFWVLFAIALADIIDVEEEDLGPDEEELTRKKRDVYDPTKDHTRVKRCCESKKTVDKEFSENIRVPRQVHQYEVHEATDDGSQSSPPYEEMLAASADHYHRIYTAPGKTARFLDTQSSNADHINRVSQHPSKVSFGSQPIIAPLNEQPVQFVPRAAVPKVSSLDGDTAGSEGIVAADQHGAASGHHDAYGHGHAHGGGHAHHGGHYGEHGGKVRICYFEIILPSQIRNS